MPAKKSPFKSAISLLLSGALVALAPGLQPYLLFAQTVTQVQTGRGNPVGNPFPGPGARGAPQGVDFKVSPAGLSGVLPSFAAPKPSPLKKGSAVSPVIGVQALPAVIAVPVLKEGKAQEQEDKVNVPILAQQLAPEIEAAGKLEKAAPDAAPGVGRRILDIILRRKSAPAAQDVSGSESAPTPSRLAKAAPQQAKEIAPAPPSPVNAVLKDLADTPPAAVVFDYDGTLTEKDAAGISLPVSQATVDGIINLLKAGIPVGFNTGRSLNLQPAGTAISMTLWEPLLSRIPAELRSNIFFAGRLGAETAMFDSEGEITGHLENDWTPEEKGKISDSIAASFKRVKASPADAAMIEAPGFENVVFKMGDARAAKFSREMMKQFSKKGLPFQINFNSKNWVYFSKFNKGDGLRLIFAAMKARGLPVTDSNLLILGDEFDTPPGAPAGGDAAGALAFPKSRAVSVGGDPAEVMPANVRRLGINGGPGSLAAVNAVLEGLAPKTASDAEMEEFFKAERGRSIRAALITASLMAVPFLWTHVALAALGGTILLSLGWIPQIVKNFREGKAATKDLAIDGFLVWFAVSALLTATSVLRHADIGWILANVSGVVRSLILVFQINSGGGDPTIVKKTLLTAAGLGAFLVPAALHLIFPAALWASAAFTLAMGLLMLINWPQIKRNYQAYEKDGSVPSGLSWSSVALITGGSALHLLAAIRALDYFWMFNSALAIVATGALLGQIFFPKQTHALLSAMMPILARVEKAARTLWDRVARRFPKAKPA